MQLTDNMSKVKHLSTALQPGRGRRTPACFTRRGGPTSRVEPGLAVWR
jgi:hypothetical protein